MLDVQTKCKKCSAEMSLNMLDIYAVCPACKTRYLVTPGVEYDGGLGYGNKAPEPAGA